MAALSVAGFLILRNAQGSRSGVLVPKWAYDLNTGKIFIAGPDQLAPFETGSGTFAYPGMQARGAGVDAHIYSCGNPADVKAGMTIDDLADIDARLVFVTRFTDAAIDALQASASKGEPNENIDFEARIMSDSRGENWLPHTSSRAFELREKLLVKCVSGEYPVAVEP